MSAIHLTSHCYRAWHPLTLYEVRPGSSFTLQTPHRLHPFFSWQKMWSLSVSKIWKLRVPVSKCISPGTNVYGRLEFSYIRYMLYMLAHTRAVPCPTSQGSHDHPGLQSHCAVEVCRHWSDQRCVYGVRRRLWWLPSRWNQHVASLVGLWAVHDPILGRMACHTEVGKARWPHVQLWLILILPPLIAIGIPW